LLDGHSGVEQFQFVQTAAGRIVLRLSAPQKVADDVDQALQARIQADLGSDMEFQVERVEAIARSGSGKHRFVIGMPVED